MNDLDAVKKLSLPEVEQKIEANRKEIKTTRAITYVFDVIIIMVAGLYVLDINFSKWLIVIPAAASVTLHTRLSILYERKCVLKQQEVIMKYLKK